MNWKGTIPTLIALIVFAALWGVVSSQDLFQEKSDEKKEPPLFKGLKPEEITTISMEEKGEIRWKLVRKDGKWSFKEPRPLPVDPQMVESWLRSFTELKGAEVVQKSSDDLQKYGLKQPQKIYRVTRKNGEKIELAVGDALPVDNGRYIQKNGEGAILQIGTTDIGFLDKQVLNLMKKEAIHVQKENIKAFSFQWKGTTLKGKEIEGEWKLEKGKKTYDPDKLDRFLTSLASLQAKELAKRADEWKQNKPQLELTLTTDDGKKHLYFGVREEDQVWIRKKEGEWAYPVAVSSLEDALKQAEKEEEDK
ncbi:protein of unknown function [Melghirimyces thermohalophilus]|uniref:DUF4340 domain-containing protein n=1 Tax=Melghirimyces thermohalophilus TaxID=1236220 RepID=A0A1G6IB75_9BACL|nr:DUF4340 domain-containing protein [Melghirimyces thermohalophilus]SDC03731.1 protein of unknown function [Melghirimyces thermohalophilus]